MVLLFCFHITTIDILLIALCRFYWLLWEHSGPSAALPRQITALVFRTAAHLVRHGLRNNLSHPTRSLFSPSLSHSLSQAFCLFLFLSAACLHRPQSHFLTSSGCIAFIFKSNTSQMSE